MVFMDTLLLQSTTLRHTGSSDKIKKQYNNYRYYYTASSILTTWYQDTPNQHLLFLFRKAAAVALDTCSPLIESNTQASEAPPVLYLRRLRAIA